MLFLAALAIFTLVGAGDVLVVRKLWRNEARAFDRVVRGDFGPRLADSVRALPASLIAGSAMVIAAAENVVDPYEAGNVPSPGQWVGIVSAVTFLAFGTISFCVHRYNRPGWIVPPHLRASPGYDDGTASSADN